MRRYFFVIIYSFPLLRALSKLICIQLKLSQFDQTFKSSINSERFYNESLTEATESLTGVTQSLKKKVDIQSKRKT